MSSEKLVSVESDFSTREHDGRTYLTIRVNEVTMQGGGQDRGSQRTSYDDPDNRQSDLDDEIPF